MEIRLGKIYDSKPDEATKIEFLDFLTEEQFAEFECSISKIEELNNIRRLLEFVTINDKEIIDFANETLYDFTHKSNSWNGLKHNDVSKAYLNLNRLLLNYLSSIRTFLDHSETFISRKFGNNSKEYFEFKEMLSFFYDNSFAYRFFYKLRNYAQHIGLPIHNINFKANYDRVNNELQGTMNITFDRDDLLLSYGSWGAVKNDLVRMKAEFDVTPLIFEMTHNITEVERNIELLQKDSLVKAANFITQLTSHLQDDEAEVFVAYNFKLKDNGELANYQTRSIPNDTINFIQTQLDIKCD